MPVTLHQKMDSLPQEYLVELESFMDYLQFKSSQQKTEKRFPNRRPGIAHDENFWIAPDFNETPECFKDYI